MNLTILKTPGFWISFVAAVAALLVAKGVITSGSTLDQVIAYVVALAGSLVGHSVAAPSPAVPPAPPATTTPSA